MTPNDPIDDPFDPKRKPKSPFDEFFEGMGLRSGEFDKMFDEMQRALSNALQNMGGFEPGKPYVHGFSFKIGPDGKPHVTEFGNRAQARRKGAKPVFSDEREPLTDLIEEDKQIAVTVEMPGVDKKDIDIRVTEEELELHVDTETRKYHKSLKLPARVKPPTTKASYKNGILDITIEKATPSTPRKGFRVNVE